VGPRLRHNAVSLKRTLWGNVELWRDDSYLINAIVFTECIFHTYITLELGLQYVTHRSSAEVPERTAATLTGVRLPSYLRCVSHSTVKRINRSYYTRQGVFSDNSTLAIASLEPAQCFDSTFCGLFHSRAHAHLLLPLLELQRGGEYGTVFCPLRMSKKQHTPSCDYSSPT